MARIASRLAILAALALVHGAGAQGGPGAAAPTAPAHYAISVRLDPAEHALRGTAQITIRDSAAAELLLNGALELVALSLDGRALDARARREGPLRRWAIPAGEPGRALSVEWQGTLSPTPAGLQHQETLGPRMPTAAERGSFLSLSSFWYPLLARGDALLLHAYRARLDLPEGQRALVAGTLLSEHTRAGRVIAEFDFPEPSEGLDLIAGPYHVAERTMDSRDGRTLTLRTWFHEALTPLADGYLDAVRDYIELYEGWIGPYPFAGFSVVSSPTPTGFGMPSLTYLGIDVLKLPFIRATSLGHEVLHNWWGNGVYPDYARGNWSEGLTTFMADYAYARRESPEKAREMRLGWLRDLSGIPAGEDRPLAAFTARHHGIARAVGYGKAAMLFVMLRERIGEEAFDRALRRFWTAHRFRVAGWDDLRAAFEAEAGESLQAFFTQWLTRPGLPELALERAAYADATLVVTFAQTGPAWQLDVPLRIDTAAGTVFRSARLAGGREDIEIGALPGEPLAVTLDPDSRMLRRLAHDEAPPILREVQLDRRTVLVALGDDALRSAARALATRLLDHAPGTGAAGARASEAPTLLIGPHDEIERWLADRDLPGAPAETAGRGDVRVWTLRQASGAPVAIIAADNAAALRLALRPLPHYGRQSWLVIEQGKALERGIWPARAPTVAVERR